MEERHFSVEELLEKPEVMVPPETIKQKWLVFDEEERIEHEKIAFIKLPAVGPERAILSFSKLEHFVDVVESSRYDSVRCLEEEFKLFRAKIGVLYNFTILVDNGFSEIATDEVKRIVGNEVGVDGKRPIEELQRVTRLREVANSNPGSARALNRDYWSTARDVFALA